MCAGPGPSHQADLYDLLGVAPDASDKDIRDAYRLAARQTHPDHRPGDAAAEERFKRVTAAYEVLVDPVRRAAYDQARRLGRAAPYRASGAQGRGGPVTIPVQHRQGDYLRDPGDRRRPGDARRRRPTGSTTGRPTTPLRGRDLRVDATVPFVDVVRGGTARVTVPGAGEVAVRVPPGIRDGQALRVPGGGAASADGGPPGDLEVVLHVQPHPRFGRRGDDLTLTLPVTYPEAALGAQVAIPLPDGARVTVRIPPGTPSGRLLRLTGRGVPTATGRGDLLVTIEILVPRSVTDTERRAIRALADAMDADPRQALEDESEPP